MWGRRRRLREHHRSLLAGFVDGLEFGARYEEGLIHTPDQVAFEQDVSVRTLINPNAGRSSMALARIGHPAIPPPAGYEETPLVDAPKLASALASGRSS